MQVRETTSQLQLAGYLLTKMEHGPLRRRGRYKKYLRDLNTPIPRTTKWRIMRRNALVRGSSLATTAPLISGTRAGTYSEGTSAHCTCMHACISGMQLQLCMCMHACRVCMVYSSLFQYMLRTSAKGDSSSNMSPRVDRIRKWEYINLIIHYKV